MQVSDQLGSSPSQFSDLADIPEGCSHDNGIVTARGNPCLSTQGLVSDLHLILLQSYFNAKLHCWEHILLVLLKCTAQDLGFFGRSEHAGGVLSLVLLVVLVYPLHRLHARILVRRKVPSLFLLVPVHDAADERRDEGRSSISTGSCLHTCGNLSDC